MDCREVRQRLNDWIDGLADGCEAQLDGHLADCPECRCYRRQMEQLMGALDYLREVSETPPVRRPRSILWPLIRVAAVLLVVIGASAYVAKTRFVSEPSPAVQDVASTADQRATTPRVRVQLQGNSRQRTLVVETPTEQPGVHLFVLYPTVQPASSSLAQTQMQ